MNISFLCKTFGEDEDQSPISLKDSSLCRKLTKYKLRREYRSAPQNNFNHISIWRASRFMKQLGMTEISKETLCRHGVHEDSRALVLLHRKENNKYEFPHPRLLKYHAFDFIFSSFYIDLFIV